MPRRNRGDRPAFTLSDRVAVREVVARQTPLRREICSLLALGCSRPEVAERLGMTHQRLHYHIRILRQAFIQAGFEDASERQTRRKRRTHWQRTLRSLRRRKYPPQSEHHMSPSAIRL
jgi:hypothetical protein